ncbi:ATP-binding response regulator [Gorillibacterium sp. sgz5001074]|uniref:ATP-binding response regulator n=1 Tax=Gorillibacterium sp. sgz5001074 TaxID=3446695 RepID=UPI003F674109
MDFSIAYKRTAGLLLLLLPALGIGFLELVTDSARTFPYTGTHGGLILTAVGLSALLGYAAYRSYRRELDRSLRYISLGYLGFAFLYAFHGFFTGMAHDHLLLFVIYGPVSRLVMYLYVYIGLQQLLSRAAPEARPAGPWWWTRHLCLFAAAAVLAGLAFDGGYLSVFRIKLIEGLSLAVSILGITRLALLRQRSPLWRYHLIAQVFFAETSLAFILSSPWNAMWWFAHAVSAAAFVVLGFAVVRPGGGAESLGNVYEETLLYPVLNRILHTSHEGIIMTDLKGRVIFTNRQSDVFFPGRLAKGQEIADFLLALKLKPASRKGKPVLQLVEELLAGRLEQIDEYVEIAPSGSGAGALYYELYAGHVTDGRDKSPLGYLFVFRNRTEEERLSQMKNDFISIVSHELRTPMASILGFTEIMMMREVAPDKRTKYLQTVYNEANRLSNLINDFLDIQRIESGKQEYAFQPADLGAQLETITEQWQGKEGHVLRLELPGQPVYAVADPDRLMQVLHNLVSNAIKYSPGAKHVDLSVLEEDGKAVIRIRDYGLGIPEASLPHLFKKFYRVDGAVHRKIKGTGLGLTIVKEIMDAHKGAIHVESKPGEGTAFVLRLPLYRLPVLAGKLAALEDDEGQSKLLSEALCDQHGELVRFTSAEEALFVLERTGEQPWLWLVDLQLEGRLDGWAFIRKLKSHPHYRDTSLVITTVSSKPADYTPDGNELYLRKPYTVSHLLKLVEELREESRRSHLLVPSYDERAIIELLHQQGLEIGEIDRGEEFSRIRLKGEQEE